MDDTSCHADQAAAGIAAVIGEPARARMLYALMDDRARTATELAAIADISPSTASAHLGRMLSKRLVNVVCQGKHRYYRLASGDVARVLEELTALAFGTGLGPTQPFVTRTPAHLRAGRTCYDHIAGTLGVALHDRFVALGWLDASSHGPESYTVTPLGQRQFQALGVDLDTTRQIRRRFAFACLDWSERRFHLAGALGAAILTLALKQRWVVKDLDGRGLMLTHAGCQDLCQPVGLKQFVDAHIDP